MADTQDLIVRLTMENGQYVAAVQNTDKANKKAEKSTKSLMDRVKGLRLGFVAVAGLLTGAVAKGIATLVKKAADFEQLNVAFTTFLGSADKAKEVLAELEKFSIVTPFTIDQVNKAGKSLLAFGVASEDLEESLRRIGDISAGTGKDFNELSTIYGKIKVQNQVFAEDLNQLTEAGIDVLNPLAEQFGVTVDQVKKLGSEGKITFDNIEQAFESLTSEGGQFFNLMEEQSKTFGGRLSTLQGNLSLIARNIGEKLIPVVGFFVDITSKLTSEEEKQSEVLRQNNDSLQARFELLKKDSQTEAERKITIEKVNKELKKLDLEQINANTSLKQLNDLQKESNDLFLKRIRLQVNKEILKEDQARKTAIATKIAENQAENELAQARIEELKKKQELKRANGEKDRTTGKAINDANILIEKRKLQIEEDKKELELIDQKIIKVNEILAQSDAQIEKENEITQKKIENDELEIQSEERKKEAILRARSEVAIASLGFANAVGDISLEIADKIATDEEKKSKEFIALRKGLFLFQKSLAIAEVAVRTALGIQGAFAQTPPPNPLLAPSVAAIVASGAANTAAIVASTIQGFEDGGIISGLNNPIGNEDGIIAAQNGESVLNREATARLGADAIQALNEGRDIPSQNVTININGGNINEVEQTMNKYFKSFGGSRQLGIG